MGSGRHAAATAETLIAQSCSARDPVVELQITLMSSPPVNA